MVVWSIGLYSGDSPFTLRPVAGIENPVLTGGHVTDGPATFVADPFMVRTADGWYMFFEVYKAETRRGEVGLATSPNGFEWSYQRIVLEEPYHLSYPYVFVWEDAFYMSLETLTPRAIYLYKAEAFPYRWRRVETLLDVHGADPSIFHADGRWWMFVCTAPHRHDTLGLYHSDDLRGPWIEHSRNPLIAGNPGKARPAGRVVVVDGRPVRFTQDCSLRYGTRVRAFEITRLDPESYTEEEHPMSPGLRGSGEGWNAQGMHHVDAHRLDNGQWLACVDGFRDDSMPR